MTVTPGQVEIIRAGVRAREGSRGPEWIRGIDRIEIEVGEGLSYRARALAEPNAVMTVDEPSERGGTGQGNTPLAHFLAGAGSCLLNQFVRVAIADDYDLRFVRARVRGEFHRNLGGGFEHVTSEIYGEGRLSDDQAESLTQRAEALCCVHNTLSKAIRMTTVFHLNGREAVRKVSGPGLAPDSGPRTSGGDLPAPRHPGG